MKKFFFALTALAALSSCAVQQKISYSESSTRNIEPRAGALITPVVGDLELVSENKIAPYTLTVPGEVSTYLIANLDGWKRLALSEAAQKYKADVLIGATVTVRTENDRLQIEVTGWPARYVNFRPATAADAWMAPVYQAIGSEENSVLLNQVRPVNR